MQNSKNEKNDTYVVADMSSVERPALLRFRLPHDPNERRPQEAGPAAGQVAADEEDGDLYADQPWRRAEESVPKEHVRWYSLGALKAGILIWAVFTAGIGLIILLMVLFL